MWGAWCEVVSVSVGVVGEQDREEFKGGDPGINPPGNIAVGRV